MRSLFLPLAASAALLLSSDLARADYAFEFDNGSTPQNSFAVNVGQTITISIYLTQDGGGTSNALNTLGLSSAGVQLNTTTPSVANVTAVAGNSAFDGIHYTTGANATLNETVIVNSPVVSPSNDPNRIYLGSFTFTGYSAGTTTSISAVTPGGASNVLGDYTTSIDNLIAGSSVAISVNAVPEPSSLILGGLLACGICCGYVKRRRLVPNA